VLGIGAAERAPVVAKANHGDTDQLIHRSASRA